MPTYPVKMLKDKDGTLFVPLVNSDSIIMPNQDTLQDVLDDKQDVLVSGTNLKTINNNSLLGSGNITISSGQATDVQINGTSIVSSNTANIRTNGTYNASTNKIATMNDLPTVPTKVSELTNDSGYTTNIGTITGIKMNGSSKGTSGVVDLGTVITAHQDISGKQDKLTSQTAYTSKGSATKVPQITTNSLGQVTGISEVTITQPTVNNATLTIQKNGTNVQTFTANQSTNATANITVPTKTSELTNDSDYVKDTDYATSTSAGVIRKGNGLDVSSTVGTTSSITYTYDQYNSTVGDGFFISKGTLNNVLIGRGYTTNTGTVTSVAVKMNNTTKGTITTSGTIDLGTVITAHQDISGKENTSNKVTSISSSSTNTQYPSALAVYNYINSLNGNGVSY